MLDKASASSRRAGRVDEHDAYQAEGALYLAPEARFDDLLTLPEAADIDQRDAEVALRGGDPQQRVPISCPSGQRQRREGRTGQFGLRPELRQHGLEVADHH
jgi:hypothetical protein